MWREGKIFEKPLKQTNVGNTCKSYIHLRQPLTFGLPWRGQAVRPEDLWRSFLSRKEGLFYSILFCSVLFHSVPFRYGLVRSLSALFIRNFSKIIDYICKILSCLYLFFNLLKNCFVKCVYIGSIHTIVQSGLDGW